MHRLYNYMSGRHTIRSGCISTCSPHFSPDAIDIEVVSVYVDEPASLPNIHVGIIMQVIQRNGSPTIN